LARLLAFLQNRRDASIATLFSRGVPASQLLENALSANPNEYLSRRLESVSDEGDYPQQPRRMLSTD
jgi:hypothetical protein